MCETEAATGSVLPFRRQIPVSFLKKNCVSQDPEKGVFMDIKKTDDPAHLGLSGKPIGIADDLQGRYEGKTAYPALFPGCRSML
jgi:hypothetical protein